jgi:hypothetical protein
MRRRQATALIGSALLTPQGVWAQEPGRLFGLGMLSVSPPINPNWTEFFDELSRAGS